MKIKLTIALSLICLFAYSQDLYTTIDIRRPGMVNFPTTVKNVIVVNNALQQPHNYGHQSKLMGQMPTNITIDTDSAILYFLSSFARSLDEEEYFGNVDLLEVSQNKSVSFYQTVALNVLQVDHLRKLYDADAIIALNRLILNDVVEDYYLDEEDGVYASLEVRAVSVWHIFLPDKSSPIPLTLSDTLVWEEHNFRRSDAINALPDRRDALLDMSIYSAQSAAHRMVPHWEQVDRYFYTHNDKEMREGLDRLYHKDWDGAINKWYDAYQHNGSKIKALASANMATAFEIEGDLNSAYYWAQEAANQFGKGFFTADSKQQRKLNSYAAELKQRIKEEEQLSK